MPPLAPAATGPRKPHAPAARAADAGSPARLVALGAGFGLAFWLLDALAGAAFLGRGPFLDALLQPGWVVAGLRLAVVAQLLVLAAMGLHLLEALRRAEDARVRAAEAARLAERERELDLLYREFINAAAHELNTPLTPIQVQVHLLKASSANGHAADATRAVAVLERNVARLAALVRLVVDVARLDRTPVPATRRPLAVEDLVREVVDEQREAARERGVRFATRVEPGLLVLGDAGWMVRALDLLLANAVAASPPGGTVGFEARRRGDEAWIAVRDHGVGLRPDQLRRVFRPFARVHAEDGAVRQGHGLGLYLAKGLVERHGGRIGAGSEGAGRGSTFWVSMPLAALGEAWRPDASAGWEAAAPAPLA